MTLVSQIVTDGYRESNLIGLGEEPDAAQADEGARLLNRLVASVFGNEVGERLSDWPIPDPLGDGIVPAEYLYPDVRVVVSGGGARTLTLNPYPVDGDRLQLIDAGSGFAANPVTLHRTNALFEGAAADYDAGTDGFNSTWMYRADIADWKKVLPLETTDDFPFPEAHDDAFVTMLATRINPRYEAELSQTSALALSRSMTQLRAAYSRTRFTPPDLAVLRMSGGGNSYGGGPATTGRYLNGIPW